MHLSFILSDYIKIQRVITLFLYPLWFITIYRQRIFGNKFMKHCCQIQILDIVVKCRIQYKVLPPVPFQGQ